MGGDDNQLLRCPPFSLKSLILCHTISMKTNNPYIENLVSMGYDRQDCEMVAAAGLDKTFPCVIHGRTFDTQEQYDEELAEYISGL